MVTSVLGQITPRGFSLNPRTGEVPATGYMVARPGHTHTHKVPVSALSDPDRLADLLDMIIMSGAVPEGAYLGGWVHEGTLWLEPADNVPDRDTAIRLGRERNQISVWDVEREREIPTGGTGA